MRSIRSKFIVYISLLVMGVISGTGVLLIKGELINVQTEIFHNFRSYSELTNQSILESYKTYYLQENEIYFERDLAETLAKNQNADGFSLFNFNGELLYQSKTLSPASINLDISIDRIKAQKPSIQLTKNKDIFYIEKVGVGEYQYLEKDFSLSNFFPDGKQYTNFVVPLEQQYALVYHMNYENLNSLVYQALKASTFILAIALLSGVLMAFFLASKISSPILRITDVVKKIALGYFDTKANVHTNDELELLATDVNKMADDLNKATEDRIYKERVKKELEIASNIQERLLPQSLPEISGFEMSAIIIPAEEIGGDVYDVIQTENQHTYFYVGDVTGHGVPAALIAAISNALISANVSNQNLIDLIDSLNEVLRLKTNPNFFITLVLLKIINESQIQYVSAGHEQIIIYRNSSRKTEVLDSGGIAVGLFPGIKDKLTQHTIDMQKDDVLVIYSDGIPECWNESKETYGFIRFQESLTKAAANHDTKQIQDLILNDIKEFAKSARQQDDITLLVLKKL
ncbi:SpoIIE family protein phosphatase [bacterium]|jgi:serine phosphatase RsbU (regulator of sigma subunit)|nr:SpoIIE family protein phosphatase [bacterium]MBT6293973.1 SpoIIE family protein phosphatase [bacterium]